MKKFVLVYNPVSGDASFKYKLDDVIAKFAANDCMLTLYRTRVDNSESFPLFMREAQADGVIISGGDGTVHEIVNLLVKNDIDLPVAIIASGTSNDFACHLGVADNLDRYIEVIAKGDVVPVDLGKAGDRYFFNVASAGMITAVAHNVDSRLKNAIGKMAYYLKGLGEIPHFKLLNLKIEADGEKFTEKAILFVVVNSGTVGSMKNIVDANISDGKLDLMVVKKCSVPEFMALAVDLVSGKNVAERKNVLHITASHIKISADESVESDLDGELGPNLPLDIHTEKHRLQVFYNASLKEK
jgi:YegS/Rv2252/BmrU family lipid kinase